MGKVVCDRQHVEGHWYSQLKAFNPNMPKLTLSFQWENDTRSQERAERNGICRKMQRSLLHEQTPSEEIHITKAITAVTGQAGSGDQVWSTDFLLTNSPPHVGTGTWRTDQLTPALPWEVTAKEGGQCPCLLLCTQHCSLKQVAVWKMAPLCLF